MSTAFQLPARLRSFSNQPIRNSGTIREEIAVKVDEWESIIAKASDANRDLTSDEKKRCDQLDRETSALQRELASVNDAKLDAIADHVGVTSPSSRPTAWQDGNGKPVYCCGPKDRLADLPGDRQFGPEDSIGVMIKAAITGNRKHCSTAIRNAMSEGSNSGGGFMVPDELARQLVDKARARSVVVRAGAGTVPMGSETLTLARVATDPTFEVKSENVAFTGSDFAFDSILLNAMTVGTLLTASRELAEDGVNFVQQIEAALANAFATQLDSIAINGVTSTSLNGILDWATSTGIGETGSVGAIAWEDFHTAATGVRLANFEPNAVVLNPDILGDAQILTSGDGTNSAKLWLGPPPSVANLMWLPTTNISTASAIVGDFSQLVYGVRTGMTIEVSREAGDSFSKHQILIKLTWRGDVAAYRRDAFWRLVGITT